MIRVILIGVLILLIARAFWRIVDGMIEGATGAPGRGGPQARPVRLARDPICGTHVPIDSSLSLTSRGTTHYFCSESCRNAFHQRT